MQRIEPIANVLNNCFDYPIKVSPIKSNVKNKPWYLRTDTFSQGFPSWINNLVRTNNTFIIAKSLRYPPMSRLENYFVHEGKSCYKTDSHIDSECARDRIAFVTLSALTPKDVRDTVIVFSTDMSIQDLFRSCSRAIYNLIIIDDARTDFIPMLINEEYLNNVNKRVSGCFKNNKKLSKEILPRKYKVINSANTKIEVPIKAHHEFIADITGLAIPMIYEFKTKGSIAAVSIIKNSKKCERSYLRFFDNANFHLVSDILKLANIYLTIYNGYKSKIYDIKYEEYDWLTQNVVNTLISRMEKYISKDAQYEETIGDYNVDIIDNNIIWEIKCKSRIQPKDIIQLTKYAEADSNNRTYRLFNIYTEEIIELI